MKLFTQDDAGPFESPLLLCTPLHLVMDTVDLAIDCVPAGNSVYLLLFLLLVSSWDFQQDTGDLAIDCIHSSISAKYLKLNLSSINIACIQQ